MARVTVVKQLAFFVVAALFLLAPLNAQDRGGFGGRRGGDAGAAAGGQATAGPTNGYVYGDCGPGAVATTSLVIVTGAIPANVPATTPQPSVKITVNMAADKIPAQAQSLTVAPDAAKGGPNVLVVSCPVVGDCVPAQTGTVSIQRREDGALFGNYQATWTGTPQRNGRFTAVWRESGKKCG